MNTPLPTGDGEFRGAADPCLNYYGRWHVGPPAASINSGSLIEFAYTGHACALAFDVRGLTRYPAAFVQVDNGPIDKTTLSASVATVPVTPPFAAQPTGRPPFAAVCSRHHVVRVWIATHSLYMTDAAGKQWATLDGGCRFLGAHLPGGQLLPLPYRTRQIEFLGDSITQGLRLLYTGTDDDTGQQLPYANWPQLAADLLGMTPVVTGFGGQGLTTSGTCGVPPAEAAFPLVYAGAKWTPRVLPRVVVIYHGTNDGVAPDDFEARYRTYLGAIATAYPAAAIFAVCPHGKSNYAAPIRGAVGVANNPAVVFLDYSSGVIAPEDTCDGCHLNPGGAVKLAVRLAQDIAEWTVRGGRVESLARQAQV